MAGLGLLFPGFKKYFNGKVRLMPQFKN